ncbi:MAG: FAD-dependent oxidoreductase [Acidobacteria bacterium]|nr:FAD-dependent oxidoreductase [Acidobacteriota bacterium]
MSQASDRSMAPGAPVDRRTFLKVAGGTALTLPWLGCSGSKAPGGSVVIVGAGLSGISTALLLEERGIAVTLVEARDRIGGRIYTMDDVVGKPDAGGPVLGASYERLLKIAKALDAPIVPMKNFETSELEYVNGQNVIAADWAGSAANKLVGAEREILPGLLVGFYAGKNLTLEDGHAWTSPKHADLDIPLDEFLRRQGASPEALRLMNIASNNNDLSTTSALWALREAQRRRDTKVRGMMESPGGNSRIPEKLATAIKGPIHKGSPVTKISSGQNGVEVTCASGATYKADYCVITVPFSVLRGITVDPPFQGAQKEAVEQIPYTAITQYFLVPKKSFWDEDKLPPLMWTDTPIERIFPQRDPDGRLMSLTCWIDGASAIKLDAMPEADQIAFVKAELARIRPSTKDNVEVARIMSWARDPYSKGAYSNYLPGQATRLKPVMGNPWQRLHFAGEHTAFTSPGMEGAMESAERVADEVLARL